MSNESKCPQCGAPLKESAPAGLCPNCLMSLNLKTETVFTDDTPAAQPPLPPDQIAPHFPQLEILECLGRGGMGVVYKARQKSLNRLVALKLLAPERVADAKFAERFTREAQALAALNHPNIVTIYDFGQAGGFYYLLMEFVDGVNLRHLLRARKFTPEEALAIVPPLCDALQFAHDRGIVHRDIKPENLLLDKSGRVKVADFGIAKMLGTTNGGNGGGTSAPGNVTQSTVGTPGYSAPEQKTDPQRVDSRADIYSLGVVFYEMLTGELPGKRIEPPSRKVHIDVRLDEIVLRALETRPELRYQQVSEVRTCVETITGTPAAPHPPVTPGYHHNQGVDYRSKTVLFGLPLLHVASGVDPNTGQARVARGIIAIGGRARGVVALGGIATGVFAFGGVATGGFAFGGLAMGVFAFGGCALGLVSLGGLAVALLAAFGGGAVAPIAIGGGAIGWLAFGGGAIGAHVVDAVTSDPVAAQFFLPWAKALLANIQWVAMILAALIVGTSVGVTLWIQTLVARQNAKPDSQTPAAAESSSRPFALKIVAALFLLMGLWSIWDMAFNTQFYTHKIDPAIFLLPVGIGLLRLRWLWRRYALACVWLGYALLFLMLTVVFAKANGVTLLLGQMPQTTLSVDILGWKPNAVQATWVEILYFLGSAALLPWMHVVLMRPKIKALFEQQRGKGTYWLETLIVIALVLFTITGTLSPARISTPAPLTKTIILTRATNQLVGATTDTRTVTVWSDTTTFPGERLRALVKPPDGQMTDASSIQFVNSESGRIGTSQSFVWFFLDSEGFGSNEADAATSQIRERQTQRPLVLASFHPVELFSVTNRRGGTLTGYVEFDHTDPAPPDASGKVKAIVHIQGASGYGHRLGYAAEVPPGYALHATANLGRTFSTSPAGPNPYHSDWTAPFNWNPGLLVEPHWTFNAQSPPPPFSPTRQPLDIFEVVLGQPKLLFSVTNDSGDVFQGFFELVGPPAPTEK